LKDLLNSIGTRPTEHPTVRIFEFFAELLAAFFTYSESYRT